MQEALPSFCLTPRSPNLVGMRLWFHSVRVAVRLFETAALTAAGSCGRSALRGLAHATQKEEETMRRSIDGCRCRCRCRRRCCFLRKKKTNPTSKQLVDVTWNPLVARPTQPWRPQPCFRTACYIILAARHEKRAPALFFEKSKVCRQRVQLCFGNRD